jgi:hypothetical protein
MSMILPSDKLGFAEVTSIPKNEGITVFQR